MTMQAYQSNSLLTLFFRSLFILSVSILIGLGTGWGTSKLQTEQWKATASFEAPNVQQLGNYYALSTTYAFLQGENNKSVEEQVFREFMRHLGSQATLQEFLSQHEYVKKYASDHKQLVEAVLPEFIQSFQLNSKYNSQINVIWKNADIAKTLLSDYIIFVASKSKDILNGELITKWKVLFQQVKVATENQLGPILQGSQIAQQDWNGKLNLMKAVQPLDNSLLPFRLQQSATVLPTPVYSNQHIWIIAGGLFGFILGLGFLGFTRFGRKSA